MFRFFFPHWHLVGDFCLAPLVKELFPGSSLNGTTIWDSNQIQIQIQNLWQFFQGPHFPYLHWFGVGNVIMTPHLQGGLAPLAFKRQAFPWRDAGPRLLRRRSEGKGEAGNSGGKSRNWTEVEMIYETVHDQMMMMMMMMVVICDGQYHWLYITISVSSSLLSLSLYHLSSSLQQLFLLTIWTSRFQVLHTSIFFTCMATGVLRCSCPCRCFRRCRGARGLQRNCGSRFWRVWRRCLSSDGQEFVMFDGDMYIECV